jgi:hypothetical protein
MARTSAIMIAIKEINALFAHLFHDEIFNDNKINGIANKIEMELSIS